MSAIVRQNPSAQATWFTFLGLNMPKGNQVTAIFLFDCGCVCKKVIPLSSVFYKGRFR